MDSKGKIQIAVLASLVSLALLLAVAPVFSLTYTSEEPYIQEKQGYIFYAPTINHAEASVSMQATSGIIPTSTDSRIALAHDLAGKLLELTAAYRYTGDERYLAAIDGLMQAFKKIKNNYGFVPEIISLDGLGYSVYSDDSLHDAIVISDAVLGRRNILTENITATRTVTGIESFPSGEPQESSNASTSSGGCPYLNYNEHGEKEASESYTCSAGASATFTVEYGVDLSKLGRGKLSIDDISVKKVYEGSEADESRVVTVDEGTMRGIKIALLLHAKEDMLHAIAKSYLEDPCFKRGFESTSLTNVIDGSDVCSVKEKLGFQARELFLDDAAVPFEIVRYNQWSRAREYKKLLSEYSLYRGAAYIEFLVSENSTINYEFKTGENLEYLIEKSDNIEVNGTRIIYTRQDSKPHFESVRVKYRPVAKRRVKIAGAFDALLKARFGDVSVFQGGNLRSYDAISTAELPSGIYHAKVLRDIVLKNESLSGEVHVRKPTDYADNEVITYTTNTLYRAHEDFYSAVKEADPVKLYIAADNLWMHSNNPRYWGIAKLAMKAMLSLDEKDFEEFAKKIDGDVVSYAEAIRAMQRFKDYYAERVKEVAVEAVKASLNEDKYSKDLETALHYIALEANLTGLKTREELQDLYNGYKAYFSKHTKSYENLKLMARHIPEYQAIVDAIESGDYKKAKELAKKLPEGEIKGIFLKRISEHEKELAQKRGRIVQLTQDAILSTLDYQKALDAIKDYENAGGEVEGELGVVRGVLESLKEGSISAEEAMNILSVYPDFERIKMRMQELKQEKERLKEKEEKGKKENETGVAGVSARKKTLLLPLLCLAVLAAAAALAVFVKRRRGDRRSRGRGVVRRR